MPVPRFGSLLLALLVAAIAGCLAPSVSAQKSDPARAAYDAQVRTLISKRWDETSARYENVLEPGNVRILFTIAPDGSARDLRVTANPPGASNLARLTREMVQGLKFPAVPPAVLKSTGGKGVPTEFTFTVL